MNKFIGANLIIFVSNNLKSFYVNEESLFWGAFERDCLIAGYPARVKIRI